MIEFLSPLGWLVGLAAIAPPAAALLRGRRDRRVRAALGLRSPRLRARAGGAAAGAVAIALLAAAAARPAIPVGSSQHIRTDAQVYYVVDVSRSMLARLPGRPTRIDRARQFAEEMQAALADVPAGVASLTNRPLPHLFPTADRSVVDSVLQRSIAIEQPPPEAGGAVLKRATTFDPLVQLGMAGYFGRHVPHRLVILLTDGESAPYSPEAVSAQLHADHIGLLVIRFWQAKERVFNNGRAEAYRPDPRTLLPLRVLTRDEVGLFGEDQARAAVRAAKAWLRRGPSVSSRRQGRLELSPYAAAAAVLPLIAVLRRRDP